MNEINVKIQVHCIKPSWVNYENNKYRLYINNDLFTERTWIWDLTTVVDEDLWVDLPMNTTNVIRLDVILQPKSVAQFGLRNLRVNNIPQTDLGGEKTELSFEIR